MLFFALAAMSGAWALSKFPLAVASQYASIAQAVLAVFGLSAIAFAVLGLKSSLQHNVSTTAMTAAASGTLTDHRDRPPWHWRLHPWRYPDVKAIPCLYCGRFTVVSIQQGHVGIGACRRCGHDIYVSCTDEGPKSQFSFKVARAGVPFSIVYVGMIRLGGFSHILEARIADYNLPSRARANAKVRKASKGRSKISNTWDQTVESILLEGFRLDMPERSSPVLRDKLLAAFGMSMLALTMLYLKGIVGAALIFGAGLLLVFWFNAWNLKRRFRSLYANESTFVAYLERPGGRWAVTSLHRAGSRSDWELEQVLAGERTTDRKDDTWSDALGDSLTLESLGDVCLFADQHGMRLSVRANIALISPLLSLGFVPSDEPIERGRVAMVRSPSRTKPRRLDAGGVGVQPKNPLLS
ncbi:hypothetical protein H5399_09045 [Tessaracoccus sp. MC1627]|uniref:hypothetical protein n=1 Tax=Tessaracoccus sp. MC1627 TaxID=2760312 RepID=UPI0016035DA2|nr:hypothetical protein [Tessaracoccus sp. MC1627]MBB1512748.1 hypothetical protein [Tessaracoccus sp. MC1627]